MFPINLVTSNRGEGSVAVTGLYAGGSCWKYVEREEYTCLYLISEKVKKQEMRD